MKYTRNISYFLLVILLLTGWEYAAQNNSTIKVLVSAPSLVVDFFANNYVDLISAAWTTFCEASAGLLVAILFSFATMILCFYYPKFMDFILPIMIISQVIPLVTLAPVFILILGTGYLSKIIMASLLCFFPIFINFANGIQSIPQSIHELAVIYNATTKQKISNIYFPLALPNIMTGLKISATLSVIGAIVAEFSGAEKGIGRNLFISAVRLEPELMVASLLMSTTIGFILFGIIILIEQKIGFWYLKK